MSHMFLFSFAASDSLSLHLLHIVTVTPGYVCGGGCVVYFPRMVDCSNTLGVGLPYDMICGNL